MSGLNWPLKFRSKVVLLKFRNVLQSLFLPDVKNKLLTGILIPIGLFCFRIPISEFPISSDVIIVITYCKIVKLVHND